MLQKKSVLSSGSFQKRLQSSKRWIATLLCLFIQFLRVFAIADHRPYIHQYSDDGKCQELMGDTEKISPTNKNRTDTIYEVMHRIDVCGEIGPMWHGANWSKKTTEQHQTHHDKPHDKDCLLHRFVIIRDNQA